MNKFAVEKEVEWFLCGGKVSSEEVRAEKHKLMWLACSTCPPLPPRSPHPPALAGLGGEEQADKSGLLATQGHRHGGVWAPGCCLGALPQPGSVLMSMTHVSTKVTGMPLMAILMFKGLAASGPC